MKHETIDRIVSECVENQKSIAEAANRILTEDTPISTGDTVASVDDDLAIGGFVGQGKVKSFSDNKQWANVELPNGSTVQIQTSLLYLVK